MTVRKKIVINLAKSLSKDTVATFLINKDTKSSLAEEYAQADVISERDLSEQFDYKELAILCDPSNDQSQLISYNDILFVMDSSAAGIAHILRNQTDVSVDAALEEWCSFLNAMFAVRKAQRSRIKLVIAQGDNSIADQYDLSGQLLCVTRPDLMAITELLEASVLPTTDDANFDIDYCLGQVKAFETQKEGLLKDSELKADKLEKQVNELAEEKEAIFAQLLTVQENLEQQHLSSEQQVKSLKSKLNLAQEQHKTLESRLEKSESESASNANKLKTEKQKNQQLQSSNDSQVTSLSAEVKDLQEKLKKSQKHIEELETDKASTSDQLLTVQENFKSLKDKYEAQLKQHQKSLQATQEKLEVALADNQSLVQLKQSFEHDKTTLVEENDLLLNQLLTVQESLEECYFSQKKLLFKLYPSLNKESQELDSDVDQYVLTIARSEYFDALWYISEYPEVIENSINPAEHYLTIGYLENKAPSPYFDGAWYLETHPDVANAQLNPLLHFELHGREEGRAAKFDLTRNELTSE